VATWKRSVPASLKAACSKARSRRRTARDRHHEFFAKRHFQGRSAVGKRQSNSASALQNDSKNPFWTIVGVVRDIRERGLMFDMKPAVYVPVTQATIQNDTRFLVVRSSNDPRERAQIGGSGSVVGRLPAADDPDPHYGSTDRDRCCGSHPVP